MIMFLHIAPKLCVMSKEIFEMDTGARTRIVILGDWNLLAPARHHGDLSYSEEPPSDTDARSWSQGIRTYLQ